MRERGALGKGYQGRSFPPMPIAVDLTELPLAVRARMHEVLTSEHAAQIVQAKMRQQRIAQFYHQNQPRSIEGVGGQDMAVDPFWIGYFNMMHGRQIWEDPDFKKWLLKEEEMFRVQSGGTKLQVGWAPGKVTFRKKYAHG